MAYSPTISRSIFFFIFFFKTLVSADSITNSSFSFNNFTKDSNFITLYDDSNVKTLIYNKPITINGGIPKKLVSFSTYFSFSISNLPNNSLAFDVFPYGYPLKKFNFLSVEFKEHVGIDLTRFMSVNVMNLSLVSLEVNGSEKMQTWIDYEPGSKRLEVRLNRLGRIRPDNPLLFVQIDLLKIWPRIDKVFVGLSLSNGNSSKSCDIHSWKFKASLAPDWMHSQPLDPMGSKANEGHEIKVVSKERDCVMKILAALIVGICCGCLGAFVVMFMFTRFGNWDKQAIVPEEFIVKSLQEYEHKKLKVVLDEAAANEN